MPEEHCKGGVGNLKGSGPFKRRVWDMRPLEDAFVQ